MGSSTAGSTIMGCGVILMGEYETLQQRDSEIISGRKLNSTCHRHSWKEAMTRWPFLYQKTNKQEEAAYFYLAVKGMQSYVFISHVSM